MGSSREVDAWFARYENPMKPVVLRIRAIMLAADPRLEECIKWQAPTFTYRGNLASFFPRSKQHASLMFHTGAHIPGSFPRLEGSGPTGRVLKIGSIAEAESAAAELKRLVVAWCDWREAESPAPVSRRASRPAGKKPTPPTSRKKATKRRQPGSASTGVREGDCHVGVGTNKSPGFHPGIAGADSTRRANPEKDFRAFLRK